MTGSATTYRGFVDESTAMRSASHQEYLIGAALLPVDQIDEVREQLTPLLLPGQIKLHWTDEQPARRRQIVDKICALGSVNIVITHLDEPRRKTERFRRKCLEELYHEMVSMEIFDLTLEARTGPQDRNDVAHLVALRSQGIDPRMRIDHCRGGDEPLLWIPDIVLGAINAAHVGEARHLEALSESLLIHRRTADSLLLASASERP